MLKGLHQESIPCPPHELKKHFSDCHSSAIRWHLLSPGALVHAHPCKETLFLYLHSPIIPTHAHRFLYLHIRMQYAPLLIDELLQFLNVPLLWDMAQLLLNMCLCLVFKVHSVLN